MNPPTNHKCITDHIRTLKPICDISQYHVSETDDGVNSLNNLHAIWCSLFSYCEFINFVNVSFKDLQPFVLKNVTAVDLTPNGEAILTPNTIYLYRGLFYTLNKNTLLKATYLQNLIFTCIHRQ